MINKFFKIRATGSYVPRKVVSNKDLEKIVATSDEWIVENLGIRERHIADKNECTSDLASKAGIEAIKNAGISVEKIDLIIVATATPDRLSPSTACIVQEKLGAFNATAFDISAVCSGFLFGLSVASQYLDSKTYNNILLIGADTFSKITDPSSRDSVYFGDGAGAVVLSNSIDSGFLSLNLGSDGRGKFNFTVKAGGSEYPASHETLDNNEHYFSMNGKAVYETGTRVLPKMINESLNQANLSIDDIDLMIPHQPGIRVLKETAKLINLPWEKVETNMDFCANTAGATIGIVLDQANKKNKLKKGSNILFAAVGSGWTYGAGIMKI